MTLLKVRKVIVTSIKVVLILFLFSFSAFAKAQGTLLSFCFDRRNSLSEIKAYLEVVRIAKDEIFERRSLHCLEIRTDANREALFRRWLQKRYTLKSPTEGQVNTRVQKLEQNCRAKIIRVSKTRKNQKSIKIGQKSSALDQSSKSSGRSVSNIFLGAGRKGRLQINQDEVELVCFPKGARFQIDLYVKAKGSIVSTSLQLRSGQEINIASVVNNLKGQGRNIDINRGIELERQRGKEEFEYFLSVE